MLAPNTCQKVVAHRAALILPGSVFKTILIGLAANQRELAESTTLLDLSMPKPPPVFKAKKANVLRDREEDVPRDHEDRGYHSSPKKSGGG